MLTLFHPLRSSLASWRSRVGASAAVAAFVAITPVHAMPGMGNGQSGFDGHHDPANWTLVTGLGNGSVDLSGAPASIILSGSNNGFVANTDYTMLIDGDGDVMFDYEYSSVDSPGLDSFGYLLNGSFTQLADSNAISAMMVSVANGDTFGFRITTFDATQGPGVVMISNFSAPMASEEAPAALPLLGTAVAFRFSRQLRKRLVAAAALPQDSSC